MFNVDYSEWIIRLTRKQKSSRPNRSILTTSFANSADNFSDEYCHTAHNHDLAATAVCKSARRVVARESRAH